ncbi:hypothetical protein JK636_17370 [Clostridium sp. YIM B02515]|uniref:Uncharacterized protein n=1 Tax=Clostridium rhizosphaerae TaxID=2803861 RepID=A0ABS1THR6_9CLOT|nr:hypothetical protein [Clostridium rhizosphaerae]MBL4937493.1 hypothetical protein [Clostridium rhizosphaerae]
MSSKKKPKIVLLTGIAAMFSINILLMNISKSYSQFNTSKSVALEATVADKGDIIKSISVDNFVNPTKIKIIKSERCKTNPIVYLELTGRLPYYVQPINPVELDDTKMKREECDDKVTRYVYEIPITLKNNSNEQSKLNTDVGGKFVAKYLNGFESMETKDVVYKAQYIKDYPHYSGNYQNISVGQFGNAIDNIDNIDVKYLKSKGNPGIKETPDKLIITRNKKCSNNPIIYFEVTGQLPYFIQHINPIELSKERATREDGDNYIYEIPIPLKVDSIQSFPWSSILKGGVYIRYLNYYCSNPINIGYSGKELSDARMLFSWDPEIKN